MQDEVLDIGSIQETTRPVRINGRVYNAREITITEALRFDQLYRKLEIGGAEGLDALEQLVDMLCGIIKGVDRTIILRLQPAQLAKLQTSQQKQTDALELHASPKFQSDLTLD